MTDNSSKNVTETENRKFLTGVASMNMSLAFARLSTPNDDMLASSADNVSQSSIMSHCYEVCSEELIDSPVAHNLVHCRYNEYDHGCSRHDWQCDQMKDCVATTSSTLAEIQGSY